jgi:3-isopropylmalate/(R)-2-methylmalate dehydratase small subunit
MFNQVSANAAYKCTVDLQTQTIIDDQEKKFTFQIDEFRKYCLLNGYDEIDITLQHADKIKDYEQRLKITSPWLFSAVQRI